MTTFGEYVVLRKRLGETAAYYEWAPAVMGFASRQAPPLFVWVNAGEVIPHQVFVALRDVVAFEGVACLLLVLTVHLLVGNLGRAGVVGIGVGGGAALLAVGVVLAF